MADEKTTPITPESPAPGLNEESVHQTAASIESLISDEFTTGEDQLVEEAEEEKKKTVSKSGKKPKEEIEPDEEEEEPSDESDEEAEIEDEDYEEPEEDEEEPDYITITIDGKDHQVTQDELIKGYHRQNDYTKKTQAVSEQRKEYETELTAIRSERHRYAENLQQMDKNADVELKKFEQIDWAELKEEDIEEYREKKDDYRDYKEAKKLIQEEKDALMVKHRNDQIAQIKEIAKNETGKLLGKIPAWKDKEKFKIGMTRLIKYGKVLGYEENEMNNILDHRHLVAIEKARKFDAFEKADPSRRKVKGKPKFTKPGGQGTKKKSSTNTRSKEKMDRLEKSGSVRDAADLIANLEIE